MTRNLIVCCDGTWNTPVQTDRGRLMPTNVVKMARAVVDNDPGFPQQVHYDTGIGATRGLDHWTAGVLGIGLTENIQQAYRYIADHYEDGDRLFLFGFSRGAYTVRSLAGLIGRCGLTAPHDEAAAFRAYDLYRQAADETGKAEAAKFKAQQRQPLIHFLGVWDTVGALGVPALSRFGLLRKVVRRLSEGSKYAHGFHDERLGAHVTHAYQALAIDERRGAFEPSTWKYEGEARANVEQTWFAGVHSNVGGGYSDSGLSDHAFMWMAVKAMDAGLKLDYLYLAMRIDPNAHGELRDSLSLLYRFLPKHVRQISLPETLNEKLHRTAIRRMEHPTNDYKPENLKQAIGKAQATDDGLRTIERIRTAIYPDLPGPVSTTKATAA